MSQNHVIDPTYFYDAIEEFAFNYKCYILKKEDVDNYGRIVKDYDVKMVRGSLQSQGLFLSQSKSGNTQSWSYNFYCKSLYRLSIGDFIFYNNKFLRISSVNDYDEWGVRSYGCEMVELSAYKDLEEFVKYEKGEKIV